MAYVELFLSQVTATKASIYLFQKKTGSILFAAISTRPDVIFVVSRLSRFNSNPSDEHHVAIDRVILYLYVTRAKALRYGGLEASIRSFIYASDISFVDNTLDRKSS